MEDIIKETTGIVKYVKRHAGKGSMDYAFIKTNCDLHDDVFVSYKEVEPWKDGFKDLYEGDYVKFLVKENKNGKGLYAANLEILNRNVKEME